MKAWTTKKTVKKKIKFTTSARHNHYKYFQWIPDCVCVREKRKGQWKDNTRIICKMVSYLLLF